MQPRASSKKTPGENQGFGFYEWGIREQVILKAARQPVGLARQALPDFRSGDGTGQDPLDPVRDAQRHRVRVPAGAPAWRIPSNPPPHHFFVRTCVVM